MATSSKGRPIESTKRQQSYLHGTKTSVCTQARLQTSSTWSRKSGRPTCPRLSSSKTRQCCRTGHTPVVARSHRSRNSGRQRSWSAHHTGEGRRDSLREPAQRPWCEGRLPETANAKRNQRQSTTELSPPFRKALPSHRTGAWRYRCRFRQVRSRTWVPVHAEVSALCLMQ